MNIEVSGFFGFLILIADIWAIINVIQSSASTVSKWVWTLAILFLPLLGLVVWFFAGPRSKS